MKNIGNGIHYNEINNNKTELYKNNILNSNNDKIDINEKKRLLHLSLMEFMKHNYRNNKFLFIDNHHTNKKKNFIITNSKFMLPYMKKKNC